MKEVTISVNENIKLRSWKLKYTAQLFQLVEKNRRYLQEWFPWVSGVKKEEDSKKFIATSLQEQKKGVGLELGIWCIDKLVGCIGLHGLSKEHRRASIGYWLDSDYQRKGIMVQSVKALIGYCFQKLNLNRVGVEIAMKNARSLALAKKSNFVKEGIVREFEFVDNHFLDVVVFSVLKREWGKQLINW